MKHMEPLFIVIAMLVVFAACDMAAPTTRAELCDELRAPLCDALATCGDPTPCPACCFVDGKCGDEPVVTTWDEVHACVEALDVCDFNNQACMFAPAKGENDGNES